ncbi:MAG TPA: hypothetical protein VFK54_09965 [Candidatus Limnocylindrales bacterium]|nr:hypothetical protein [Candidatus Limnocylindrales bacterium]
MRVTLFTDVDGQTAVDARPDAVLEPMADWQGTPLSGVRWQRIHEDRTLDIQLVEIAAGGQFVMHSSPSVAFCQIVRGRGALGLPDGTSVPYAGPELFVFLPNSRHDWHDIAEDTLLAVCLVAQP